MTCAYCTNLVYILCLIDYFCKCSDVNMKLILLIIIRVSCFFSFLLQLTVCGICSIVHLTLQRKVLVLLIVLKNSFVYITDDM